jgi:DNA modification methylase
MKPYYQDDAVTLYNGNCLEILNTDTVCVGAADALLTDPPFSFSGGISNGVASSVDSQFFLHWWKSVAPLIVETVQEHGEGFIWCDWRSAPIFEAGFKVDQKYSWRLAQMLYHHRQMPGMGKPFRNSVDTIAYVRGPHSKGSRISATTLNWISDYWYYGKHAHHPAEKSVNVARQLVEWCSDPGDIILDPFAGGGTSLIAAKQSGRKAIGIELEERYCEVIAKRLQQAQLDFKDEERTSCARSAPEYTMEAQNHLTTAPCCSGEAPTLPEEPATSA